MNLLVVGQTVLSIAGKTVIKTACEIVTIYSSCAKMLCNEVVFITLPFNAVRSDLGTANKFP